MTLDSRPYFVEQDLDIVRDFLSRCMAISPPQTYWHPGDFVWTLFQNRVFDPASSVGIWSDESGTVGVAVFEEPDGVAMQVRPDLRGKGIVEKQMLRWARSLIRDADGRIRTTAVERPDKDNPLSSFLKQCGFTRDRDHYLNMHRDLASVEPRTPSPDGWMVRSVGAENEWQRRVDIHREVWHPSRVTLEAYRRMRKVRGYDPSLDLVAVNEEDEFGAYCICWYDPNSRTGLFEPVGTAKKFRRTGLSRAVMHEGISRLRRLGAESALVTSAGSNDAARSLYESIGFRVVGRESFYSRSLEGLDDALDWELPNA